MCEDIAEKRLVFIEDFIIIYFVDYQVILNENHEFATALLQMHNDKATWTEKQRGRGKPSQQLALIIKSLILLL